MAKKKNTVTCRYKYCKHDSKQIPREEAVLSGKSSYYHQDCFKEKTDKDKIIKLFSEEVNPNIPFPQIVRTINDIINKRGFSSDYLLFGLRYYIDNKITLNYPGGLYYVVANKDVEREYKKQIYKHKPKFAVDEEIQGFEYHQPKRKTLDNFME